MDEEFKKEIKVQSQDLSKEALETTLFVQRGTVPVLLTVPHDGHLEAIAGVAFIREADSRPRDAGVSYPAREIFKYILNSRRESPNLVIQRVHRAFVTPQIQTYFENQVINLLSELAASRQKRGGKILLLDLHGFTHQPVLGEFDLILGTGHRQTVRGINIDYEFASFMKEKGYRVYTPSESSIEGERYGATNPRTLIQKVRLSNLNKVLGLQIEIARHFRLEDDLSIRKGIRLSRDMGDFLIHWYSCESQS